MIDNLPNELKSKIQILAHPKIDYLHKKSLEITSVHHIILRLYTVWKKADPLFRCRWQEMIYFNLSQTERYYIFNILSQCGCCHRHSNKVFKNSCHCCDIQGSLTKKKFNKKIHEDNKEKICTCWCRHQIRWLIRADDKIESLISLADIGNNIFKLKILRKVINMLKENHE